MEEFTYLKERFKPQLAYFEEKSALNQKRYLLMRQLMLVASWLTPIGIFVQFVVPIALRDYWSLVPIAHSDEFGHRFRNNSATDSNLIRPLIPKLSGRL